MPARSDGKIGPQLRPSEAACDAVSLPGSWRPDLPDVDRKPACGFRVPRSGNVIQITATGVTIDRFANRLAFYVQRIIVNRSGLAGTFDLDVEFAREFLRPAPADDPSAAGGPPATAVSIFT